MPGIAVFRCNCAVNGRLNIGVIEHDKGRIAAEFEGDFLYRSGALPHQDFANSGRTGKREFSDQRAVAQFFAAGSRMRSRDDVNHTGRYLRARRELCQRKRAQRCVFSRLDYCGAAGREGGSGEGAEESSGLAAQPPRQGDARRLAQALAEGAGGHLVAGGVLGADHLHAAAVPVELLHSRLVHAAGLDQGAEARHLVVLLAARAQQGEPILSGVELVAQER